MKSLSEPSLPVAAARAERRRPRQASTAIKRILAPTDLTERAKKGVTYAARLARHFGAELYLLHIYQEPCVAGFGRGLYDFANRRNYRRLIEEKLLALQNEIRAQCPRCNALLEYEGPPCRQIAAAAQKIGADLIIISIHNRNWLGRLVFGNDAEVIARSASCPVLVFGRDERETLSES